MMQIATPEQHCVDVYLDAKKFVQFSALEAHELAVGLRGDAARLETEYGTDGTIVLEFMNGARREFGLDAARKFADDLDKGALAAARKAAAGRPLMEIKEVSRRDEHGFIKEAVTRFVY